MVVFLFLFFFQNPVTTELYTSRHTLSLHDALPISTGCTALHNCPNFSGPPLPVGTGFFMRFPTYRDSPYVAKYQLDADKGRETVTGKPQDGNFWRVPTDRKSTRLNSRH